MKALPLPQGGAAGNVGVQELSLDNLDSSMKALPPAYLPANRTCRQGRERNRDFTQVKLTLRSSMKAPVAHLQQIRWYT